MNAKAKEITYYVFATTLLILFLSAMSGDPVQANRQPTQTILPADTDFYDNEVSEQISREELQARQEWSATYGDVQTPCIGQCDLEARQYISLQHLEREPYVKK